MEKRVQNFKLQKFSPSMLSDYLACPKSFYYHYVSGIELPQKQIHLLFGSAVHRAIEAIYDKDEPFGHFVREFNKNKLQDDEKDLFKEFFDLGHEMIKNYIKDHVTLNALYNLDKGKSELYVRRNLINPLTGEETDIPMSGRIDRLTDDHRIVEYKTSKSKWNPGDIAYRLQTLLYNLWFYSEYNELPLETIYIILLKKYKKVGRGETHQVLSNNCTLTELASAFDEVSILINKINNNEFDRPLKGHPHWCDCLKYDAALNISE